MIQNVPIVCLQIKSIISSFDYSYKMKKITSKLKSLLLPKNSNVLIIISLSRHKRERERESDQKIVATNLI